MSRRTLWIVLTFVAGALAGRYFTGAEGESFLGATPAVAGQVLPIADGQTFVTSHEGSAYLWRRTGDRLSLLGECARTAEGTAAATFVWLPGVERES